MSETPIVPKSPSSSQLRSERAITARKNRQHDRESPPPTTPHGSSSSSSTSNSTKKKEKTITGPNPDLFTFDLTIPMAELQISFFGDPGIFSTLNTTPTTPIPNMEPTNSQEAQVTRASTPQPQKRKGSARTRTRTKSLPDKLTKSVPPIHSIASSAENGSAEAETTERPRENTLERNRPTTTNKTTRELTPTKEPKLQSNGKAKKPGPITASDVQLFSKPASNIAESINTLKVGLQDVEKAIKADNEVIQKHQVSLQQLELKRQNLMNEIKEKEDWLQKYSNNVQPLQDQTIGLHEKVGQVKATLNLNQKKKERALTQSKENPNV